MSTFCNGCGSVTAADAKRFSDLEKALRENESKDFQQDGYITQLLNMYRCDVKQAVSEYMEVLYESGELDELLSRMEETRNPYYSGIFT